MATCKAINKPDYELKLTSDEAGTLRKLFHHVGGSPEGPRGHIDAIARALAGAGAEAASFEVDVGDSKTSIYFKR